MSKVDEVLSEVGEEARNALLAHLEGGTSANWISDWLKRAGHPVGPTTLKEYRRRLKDDSR